MKFFKCHSQKMKDDKFICLQDKFTDIGPDVFEGFKAEFIIFSDGTKAIRNYAFSGLGKCSIYLPRAVEEIEPLAFENMNPEISFYCVKGSYAEQICTEFGLNVNNNVSELFAIVDEQKKNLWKIKNVRKKNKEGWRKSRKELLKNKKEKRSKNVLRKRLG